MKKFLKGFRGMGFVVQMVVRVIFGGENEKLTGGWREFYMAFGEWDLWCMWC